MRALAIRRTFDGPILRLSLLPGAKRPRDARTTDLGDQEGHRQSITHDALTVLPKRRSCGPVIEALNDCAQRPASSRPVALTAIGTSRRP